tara:strand:+ start:171 stop:746 length:576 start_codon:yes stop_codon:yes gene_type:complete
MQKPVIQCILAAGESRRMGSVKALIELHYKSLLQHHIEGFNGVSIVVLGCHKERILQSVNIENFVYNDHWKNGQFSSIQRVLAEIPKGFDAFILPVDHFPIQSSTYIELMNSRKDEFSVIQPHKNGKNGHPVLLSEKFIQEIIKSNPKNNRLDHLIRQIPVTAKVLKEVEDSACYQDLNLPSSINEEIDAY